MSSSHAHTTGTASAAPRSRDATAPRATAEPLILAAYAILRRELEELVALRPTPHVASTAEEIHQLRVAARRLRVGLRLFRRMLPTSAAVGLRAELRWFGRALGEVRDLDVYADNFRAYARHVPPDRDLGAYELYLRRARTDARARLARLTAEPRVAALFDAAATALVNGPSPGALRRWRSLSVRDGVRASIRSSLRRVRKLGDSLTERSTPAQLHALRIRAKRLRYELEFFAEIYPALMSAAKATKTLQDVLGEHQDAYAASARLRRYAATLRAPGAPPTRRLPPALDELRKGQLRHARDIRRSFAAHWQRFLPSATRALETVQ